MRFDFPGPYGDVRQILSNLPVALRKAEPFSSESPVVPKRQRRSIGGKSAYCLMPVHQANMNRAIEAAMRPNWEKAPYAAVPVGARVDTALRGDFVRERVFVEVEFGNSASMYRDLSSFRLLAGLG
jgi:hypothetical protein